jgi:4-carboxymuconolactone decarboxylase
MSRIPLPPPEEMSAEQRKVYGAILSGPRGKLVGPLRAILHCPELAARWSEFGEYLRYRTCLPRNCNELAIVATGRRWNSEVEFRVHAAAARSAGVDPEVIEAIRMGRPPLFRDAAEAEVYEFARQMHQAGTVPEPLYRAVKARWGVAGVVELTALIGYYTMVSMTLNAHEIEPLDGGDPELGTVAGNGLTDLPPAAQS